VTEARVTFAVAALQEGPITATGAKGRTARALDEEGRASDGKPIVAGDVFRTSSGRPTTPYPRQKGWKYASQWLIDNAIAEAESRGDDFNATGFRGERPLTDGALPTATRDCMLAYLFGEQPAVPRPLLKPLGATRREARVAALGQARTTEALT